MGSYGKRDTDGGAGPAASGRIPWIALVAAAVPVVWSFALLDAGRTWPLTVLMAGVSALFWSLAGAAIGRIRDGRLALASALAAGLASPFLGAWILLLLLLPVWPLLLLRAPESAWIIASPLALPRLVLAAWQVFLPVGAGMGLVAFLLVRPRSRRRGHLDHGSA